VPQQIVNKTGKNQIPHLTYLLRQVACDQYSPRRDEFLRVRVLDSTNEPLRSFVGEMPGLGNPGLEIFLPWPAVVRVGYKVESQPLLGSDNPALEIIVPQIPEL
jgi:hypothetical protein